MVNDFININSILRDYTVFLAHIGGYEGAKEETLAQHTLLCQEYFTKIVESKDLEPIFHNIYRLLFDNNTYLETYLDLIKNTLTFHDLGKTNPKFQTDKMKNKDVEKDDYGISSKHSILSSLLYVYYYSSKIEDKGDGYSLILSLLYINSFIISRHHSGLIDLDGDDFFDNFDSRSLSWEALTKVLESEILSDDFVGDMDLGLELMDDGYNIVLDELDSYGHEKKKVLYIYARLLYSVLVASDYYATTQYMNGLEMDLPKLDAKGLKEVYNKSSLMKSIREKEETGSYRSSEEMNDVRTRIFLEVEKAFEQEKDKRIFLLESPTGSGKSNIALNLSYKMMDQGISKILYAYPFNTLVEQNKEVLDQYYKETGLSSNIAVINSVTEIKVDNSEEISLANRYNKALIDRQFMHYPFVLTSNIYLFNLLFSDKREDIFALYQLANSVIVLDEIQAYDQTLWNEIIDMLYTYSVCLNIKFIIMSATLPDLSKFLDDDRRSLVSSLIKNPKDLFAEKVFKDRVKIDFALLEEGKIDQERLEEHLEDNISAHNKILLEFIYKKAAEDFYRHLIDKPYFSDYSIYILTGNDNIRTRKSVIDRIKGSSDPEDKIILIATQVVEAGVDIDMDMGYKDISMLENEEQFLGRINRKASKENSLVYFFDLSDESKIYKNQASSNTSLRNLERRINLVEKDFTSYFDEKIKILKENKSSFTGYMKFKDDMKYLNFKSISKHMKLIDDKSDYVYLFLSRSIKTDEGLINGNDIWQDYKDLINNYEMNYSEKMVKISKARIAMNDFLYRVNLSQLKEISSYNDRLGDIYFFENGEEYLLNGRLNLSNDQFGNDII